MTDITSTFHAIAKDRENQLAASKNRLQQEGRWLFLSWKEKQRQEQEKSKEEVVARKTPTIAFALEIQQKIDATQAEVQKLGKSLAKRFNAFDDGALSRALVAVEASSAEIHQNLKILEQLIAATGKNYVHNTQTEHHLKMIVDSLQGKVRKLDNEIKQKRELRVKNLENQSRISSVFNGTMKPKQGEVPRASVMTPEIFTPTAQPPQHQQQQLQTQTPASQTVDYSGERLQEITRIQRTIEEVAGVYRTLADYVWAQQEPIESIYHNVSRAEHDVEKGQEQLIISRSKMASNRGLILKLFATLFCFIVVFFFFFV